MFSTAIPSLSQGENKPTVDRYKCIRRPLFTDKEVMKKYNYIESVFM